MSEALSPAEVQALKKEILSSLHCALPGIVESFDDSSGTAFVRLALSGMPVLQDVPVFVCNEVSVGDGYSYVFLPVGTDDSTEIQIVGKLAAPVTVQLAPEQITAFMGTNRIWADTPGELSVVYLDKR